MVSLSESDFEIHFLSFLSKTLRRGFRSCILHFCRNKVKELKFWKKNAVFGFIAKFFDDVVKTALYKSKWPFWSESCSWKIFGILSHSHYELNFSNFFQLNFCKVLQTAFYVSIGTFRRKKFLKKYVSFLNIFGFCVNNFCLSAIRTSLWLSKMDSTCPKQHFEAKKFFLKSSNFETYSYIEQHKFRFFVQKSRRGRQSSTPWFCWNIPKKNNSSEKFHFFKHLLEIGWRNFGFLPQKTREVAEKAIDVSFGPV